MQDLVLTFIVPLILSLALTPLFREAYRAAGYVDRPDGARKTHRSPIPRAGGAAIMVSFIATIFLLQFQAGVADPRVVLLWRILPATVIVFIVGMIDDLLNLKPWQKLAGQLVAAGFACWNQVLIGQASGAATHAWWSIPLTIFWLIACANAFNLVDGTDGLSAGAGLFAALALFAAALLQQNLALTAAALLLSACLFGFLRYNFTPATIFLGDAGSLTIGFILGCYCVIWTQSSTPVSAMTASLIALAFPLLDVTLTITRRLLNRRPIFGADRGHIHHRLLDRGMSPRKVALILYAICGIAGVFAVVAGMVDDSWLLVLVSLLFAALVLLGIRYLSYSEFGVVRVMLFGDPLRHAPNQARLYRTPPQL